MCTVTIIPKGKNDFVLISNRDEAPNRISLAPDYYTIENSKMLFPKDKLAGGSWIGASEKNRVLCVLNGGFHFHKRKDNYRLSRGVVMKDLLASDEVTNDINEYDLLDVEPFTLVIVDWNEGLRFMELVWDGKHKHLTELPLAPKLWSSSTLYTPEMKKERQQWFEDFKQQHPLNAETLLDFHTNTQKENIEYGVVMDRNLVKTTSITQVHKEEDTITMQFTDLETGHITNNTLKTVLPIND